MENYNIKYLNIVCFFFFKKTNSLVNTLAQVPHKFRAVSMLSGETNRAGSGSLLGKKSFLLVETSLTTSHITQLPVVTAAVPEGVSVCNMMNTDP